MMGRQKKPQRISESYRSFPVDCSPNVEPDEAKWTGLPRIEAQNDGHCEAVGPRAAARGDDVAPFFMKRESSRRFVGYLEDLRSHADSFGRGATFLVGGFALILVGTFTGTFEPKLAQVAAGTIATTGIVVAFLGFFVYILPPLLPAK